MNPNPFSPSFAILPASFYGRSSYIDSYGKALDEEWSAQRLFFLTGTRGSGKTSLLHQYEIQATRRRWSVIRATNIDLLSRLSHYAGLDQTVTKSSSPGPTVSIGGLASASLGERGKSVEVAPSLHLLSEQLIQKLKSPRNGAGLAIIVDEAQKLDRNDAVIVLNAVQDVRSAGLPISLVLCGLPSSYNRIRSLSDVTFIRRTRREKLWTMTKTETLAFLSQSFARVPEISLTKEQVYGIGSFSGGHPYLLQLIGDHLYRIVERDIRPLAGQVVPVSSQMVELAEQRSLVEYKDNVLNDVLRSSHSATVSYIRKAYDLRDKSGRISVSELNAAFGKNAQEMSMRRTNALNTQVIKSDGRGYLRFALPHCRYLFEELDFDESEVADDEWEL